MNQEIKNIYNDLERLRKLNKVLSDKNFYEQRGYFLDEIPENLLELSFPVKNPVPLLDKNIGYILDIGCGSGLDIYLFKKYLNNKKIFGIDISMSLLIESKKVTKELVCANAIEIPFKSGVFSTIVMNGVFNLINDKRRLINEVKRVLSKSGTFIVADIYKNDNITLSDEAEFFNLGKALSLNELFELFASAGFRYEFGEYEKDIIPEFGIFIMKWRKE